MAQTKCLPRRLVATGWSAVFPREAAGVRAVGWPGVSEHPGGWLSGWGMFLGGVKAGESAKWRWVSEYLGVWLSETRGSGWRVIRMERDFAGRRGFLSRRRDEARIGSGRRGAGLSLAGPGAVFHDAGRWLCARPRGE